MAELVVYLGAELLAAEVTKAFVIGLANSGISVTFLRAAIYAGSFIVTTKVAQNIGLIGGSTANELKGQTINVRSSTAPRQLIYGQSLVGGVMFYAATTGNTNEYLHTVFGLADHQIQSVEKVYFGDEDVGTVSGTVSSGRYSGKARIQNSLTGGTAYADLVTETAALTNKWTSSHKLTGISSVYVRMQYDTSIFTSIPTVRALVKGKLVYDPRSTTTAWSDNPALCIRDYIMSEYGMRVTSDEIDSASFIAAANICDETVTVKTAVTQKRYTLNGVVDTSKSPREVLQDMLSTCAGMLIYSSGKYKLIVGAFSSPVQTITVDDLRGDVQLSCANEKANLFNRVAGVFADADKLYSATEYPAIASSTFKTQDGNEELSAQLDLNFTTNYLEAQRLAKINLLKSRQGIVVSISCKPTCLNITAGDVVALTIAQLGWSGKYFRVMEWKLNEDIGVDLVLKEEDSTAYDWSTSDAQDNAPNTSLTLIQPQAAPTGLTATNQNLSLPDGTILPGVRVTWTAVSSAYVTGYELQIKLTTDTIWQSIFTSQTVFDYAGQQEVALVYNVRVRAIFSDKEGPFSTTINHTLSGDTTAPSAPTSLSAVGAYKTIQLSWTNPTAADWFYNEIWENTSNNSATATRIGTVSGSTLARSGLTDSTTKYYWLKAVDFSRNVSGFSSVASATTDSASASGDSVDIVFQRSATQPSTPSPSVGTPAGWYSDVNSVPASSDPMWSSVGTNTGSGTNYTWQTPLQIEGQDGADGSAGLSVAEVSIFKRSATAITTAPTGGSFDFSTNTLTPPSTWSATVPSGTDPVYISRSVASISGTTGTDSTLTWSTPTVSFQNGDTGATGSSARIMYARIASNPTPVSGSVVVSGDARPTGSQAGAVWGAAFNVTYYANDPDTSSNNSLYVADGLFDGTNTTWSTPYIAALKVGALSAVSTNTGSLTVSGTLQSNTAAISGTTMTGSGGVLYSTGNFAFGKSTQNIVYNGTDLVLNGLSNKSVNQLTSSANINAYYVGSGSYYNLLTMTKANGVTGIMQCSTSFLVQTSYPTASYVIVTLFVYAVGNNGWLASLGTYRSEQVLNGIATVYPATREFAFPVSWSFLFNTNDFGSGAANATSINLTFQYTASYYDSSSALLTSTPFIGDIIILGANTSFYQPLLGS